MSAYWPVVQARLVQLLPTLLPAGVVVFDGPSAGGEKGARQYVTVGATSNGDGGSYQQPDSPITGVREEHGDVACELVDWSGDTDIAAKRAVVFGWVDALEAYVRTDQSLGVLPPASSVTLSGDFLMTATSARLTVTVAYDIPATP